MHPTLFYIGSKAISNYGIFVALGYIIGILTFLYLSKKQKLPLIEMASYVLFGLVVCVLGGKVFLLITKLINNFSYYYQSHKEILVVFKGGGAFYGGVIAGTLFSLWYLNKMKLPLWRIADIVGVSTALGFSIMKIGCFMAGCCYGRFCSLPWALKFPHLSQSVHPTQLYESGFNFFNFIFLAYMLKKKKFDGQIICYNIFINSTIRFLVEYFRGDPGRGYLLHGESAYTSLSVSQLIGLIGLVVGVVLYNILKRKNQSYPIESAGTK